MMKGNKRVLASILGMTVATSTALLAVQPAQAAVLDSPPSQEEIDNRADVTEQANLNAYSQREVLQLLLAGEGVLADNNPGIVESLGFHPDRAPIEMETLDIVVDAYAAFNPTFQSDLMPYLTSGNPKAVTHALKEFYTTVISFWETDPIFEEARTLAQETSGFELAGRGVANVNVNVNVNVNAAAALAVVVVVVAGVVAVAAVAVVYLDDVDKPYGIDHTNMVRDLTTALL